MKICIVKMSNDEIDKKMEHNCHFSLKEFYLNDEIPFDFTSKENIK